ncbi:MAG: glycogen synthase GlgA [Alphaproteobacteria bacterium]
MKILFAASECAPFIKTGGLADVVGSLPGALAGHGAQVRVLLPAYADLPDALLSGAATSLGRVHGRSARIIETRADGLELLLLDAPHLYGRTGNPYLDPKGKDWPDNHLRFGALSWAGARIARGALKEWQPDVVHAHDWQAGLIPAYLRLARKPAPPSVMTVHNMAFQGLFPARTVAELGLPRAGFTADGFEYWNQVSFLKAGLVYADRITTVSPTYARELMTPDCGMGLEGVLAHRRDVFTGILNGIDTAIWDPANDPAIAANYAGRTLKGKAANKAALEARFGLPGRPSSPLFCVVSRLTGQKGMDVLLEVLPHLVARGGRLVLLGTGERDLEAGFRKAVTSYPDAVGAVIDYDEQLSHLMQAGSDAILIPSRFEPCGLTQLYGLRYGTLPLVARTGGLADTIIDANDAAMAAGCATGFQFAPVEPIALTAALDRACDIYEDRPAWRAMMRRAMKHPVSWDRSAGAYMSLYRSVVDLAQ